MPSYSGIVEETMASPLRLDRYVAERLALLSRSQLKARCQTALVNQKKVKISYAVKGGDTLALTWSDSAPLDLIPEDLPLSVLYEDENVAVINKQQGMVVHPGAGNHHGTLANALLFRRTRLGASPTAPEPAAPSATTPTALTAPVSVTAPPVSVTAPPVPVTAPTASTIPPWRLGIVHRLDKDTSGVIIAAYNNETLAFLAAQFKNRQTRKVYAAVVHGTPAEQAGVIETYISRDRRDRKRFAVSTGGTTARGGDTTGGRGKLAVTKYRVLRSWGAYSLLLLRPKTGRTHQLRVQLRHLGHPILGDPVYGVKDARFPAASLMLHAKSLGIVLPRERKRRVFTTPLPERFLTVLRALGIKRKKS
jgi:23S rRNA pseudouridine1911/1915/1917 synthase